MKTFEEYVNEHGFNNLGVPHYADSETPAIKQTTIIPPPNRTVSGETFSSLQNMRNDRQKVYIKFGVLRFSELIGKNIKNKTGNTGVITNANEKQIYIKWNFKDGTTNKPFYKTVLYNLDPV